MNTEQARERIERALSYAMEVPMLHWNPIQQEAKVQAVTTELLAALEALEKAQEDLTETAAEVEARIAALEAKVEATWAALAEARAEGARAQLGGATDDCDRA